MRGWNKLFSATDRTTAYSQDIKAPDWVRGVVVAVHLTAITGAPGLTPSLRYKIAKTDNYQAVVTGSKLSTADSHGALVLYPESLSVEGLSNIAAAKLPLLNEINVSIAVDNTDKATYDIYFQWLR
jgi:hypothetical protein